MGITFATPYRDTVAKMKTFIIVPFVMLISSVYLMPNGPPQEKQGQGQLQGQGQGQGQGQSQGQRQGQGQRQIEKRSAKEIDENDDATNDDQLQGQGQRQGQEQRQIEKRSAKEIDENDDATNDDQSDNFSDHEPNQPPSVNQAGH